MEKKQIVGYDITISSKQALKKLDVELAISPFCKKWVFQRELSDSGYKHWQCRVHLVKRRTFAYVRAKMAAQKWCIGHWTITSKGVHEGNSFNYVMKADTKDGEIDSGPFTELDFTPPPKMTRQLAKFQQQEMYPWQKQLLEMVCEEDDRSIKVIYDPVGDSGKSIMVEYIEYHRLGFEMAQMMDIKDIMQFCFSFGDQKCYMVDLPRAMRKDRMANFYSGLEALKNGCIWETRYCGKKRRIDRPQVIVFSNVLPELAYLSKGRWEIWELKNNDLSRWVSPDIRDYTSGFVPGV